MKLSDEIETILKMLVNAVFIDPNPSDIKKQVSATRELIEKTLLLFPQKELDENKINNIIENAGIHINIPCPRHPNHQECALCEGTGKIYEHTKIDKDELAKTIVTSKDIYKLKGE